MSSRQPPHTPTAQPLPDPSSEPGGSELRIMVSKIMTTPVRCATDGMSIESVAALFLDQGISAVPVIDAVGKPIGVVTKTDLLRRYYEDGEDGQAVRASNDKADGDQELGPGFHLTNLGRASVADVMTPTVFAIGMDASVAQAAAIMAYEGVHHVVVTSRGGMAVGIVSSLDVLRWVARRIGYVIPARTRRQTPE